MKHYTFIADWWWGKSITFVELSQAGIVELQFDNTMPNVGYVKGIIVREEERRKGYGRYLLATCEDYARLRRKRWMQLTCDKSNTWLVDWYLHSGYDVIDVGEHEYTMMKKL